MSRPLPKALVAVAAAALAWLVVLGAGNRIPDGTFLAFLFVGLSTGALYAFIALGYTMVYGIIRLINFAHGEFFMAGAFAGYFVLRDAGLERLPLPQPLPIVVCYLAALLAGALLAGVLAVVADLLCYRPIRGAGRVAALLTAVGLSLFLQNAARQWPAIGPTQRPWPSPKQWTAIADVPTPANARYYEVRTITTSSGKTFEKERVLVDEGEEVSAADRARLGASAERLVYRKFTVEPHEAKGFVIVMLVLATIALWFLVQRTRMGKAMRAVSEDREAALLMGIPVNRVIAATFFLGAFLAGLGGVAHCTIYGQVDPLTGFMPGLKAFVAAVLGGIGSIPGAVVGGLFLGVLENLFGAYGPSEWRDALAFLILIAVLLVKPTGLLGRERREKV